MSDLSIIERALVRNGKGNVATPDNIARVRPLIKTNAQALQTLTLAHETLWKAYQQLDEYNLVDVASGVARANLSLITSTIAFIERLRARIPDNTDVPTEKDAGGTALVLLQAIDCLRVTDLYTRQSNDFSYADSFIESLAQVLEALIKKVIVPVAKATASLWVPLALVAGGVLVVNALGKSR